MRRIFLLILLFSLSILSINALETACIIPAINDGENNEENLKYSRIITEIQKFQVEDTELFNAVISEEIEKKNIDNTDLIIHRANMIHADIIITSSFFWQKEKFTLNIKSYYVKNGKLLYNNVLIKSLSKNINIWSDVKNFIENFTYEMIFLFKKTIKEEIQIKKINEYKNGFDISFGIMQSPFIFEKNLRTTVLIKENYYSGYSCDNYVYSNALGNIEYFDEEQDFDYSIRNKYLNLVSIKFIPLSLNFSSTFYLNYKISLGLSAFFAYSAGVFLTLDSYYAGSTYFDNTFYTNLSFRVKSGNIDSLRLIWDIGFLNEIEMINRQIKNYNGYITDKVYSFFSTHTERVGASKTYIGNYSIGFGPYLAFGIEKYIKNFAFEVQIFISPVFGWNNTDADYRVDFNTKNINILAGVLLKWNYYKFIPYKK